MATNLPGNEGELDKKSADALVKTILELSPVELERLKLLQLEGPRATLELIEEHIAAVEKMTAIKSMPIHDIIIENLRKYQRECVQPGSNQADILKQIKEYEKVYFVELTHALDAAELPHHDEGEKDILKVARSVSPTAPPSVARSVSLPTKPYGDRDEDKMVSPTVSMPEPQTPAPPAPPMGLFQRIRSFFGGEKPPETGTRPSAPLTATMPPPLTRASSAPLPTTAVTTVLLEPKSEPRARSATFAYNAHKEEAREEKQGLPPPEPIRPRSESVSKEEPEDEKQQRRPSLK